MSFLLKIVQGPNAGAEIALIEGTNLSVGTSSDCDIVLTDAALAARAFELEVSQERVVVIHNGRTLKLAPYHVTVIGTTALVVGSAEEAWKELVWPAPTKASLSAEEEALDEAIESAEEKTVVKPARKRSKKSGVFLLFLLLLGAGIGFAFWKYPEQSKAYSQQTWAWIKATTGSLFSDAEPEAATSTAAEAPEATLETIAQTYGFTLSTVNDKVCAKGDFKTRAERLTATAQAYAMQPGILLDFADDESLRSAMEQHLDLISEGGLKVVQLQARQVALAGRVDSQADLEKILLSIRTDMPKIVKIDCEEVVITPPVTTLNKPLKTPRKKTAKATAKNASKMPVVGILTIPYPCLVLSDGTRAMEGARFGDYTIQTIATDHVVLGGPQGSFIWRP